MVFPPPVSPGSPVFAHYSVTRDGYGLGVVRTEDVADGSAGSWGTGSFGHFLVAEGVAERDCSDHCEHLLGKIVFAVGHIVVLVFVYSVHLAVRSEKFAGDCP